MIHAAFSIKPLLRFGLQNIVFFFFLFCTESLKAQPPLFRTYNYIETYAKEAVHQMIEYKIPASVTLAQAIIESRSGTSELAKRSNNHFGIKCHVGWVGDTIVQDDDSANECFRKYSSIRESYTDHSVFLASRPWYTPLFGLSVTDYKSWCYGLKNAGYATSPTYAQELIKLIEENELYVYDASEKLERKFFVKQNEKELMPAKMVHQKKSLREFSASGILFQDEKDILVQSLHYLVLKSQPERIDLAEN